MPYICELHRKSVEEEGVAPGNAGQLAYFITMAILDFFGADAPHFQDYATALGVLDACGKELYRKMAAPYEDQKCKENGEVYPIEIVNYEK